MTEQSWPVITVVTPSYNQGQYLERTIQSVLGQNYPALDYIVMDGGSTDNSVEIIKKYEKKLGYWQSQKDGGQSAAINTGFSKAKGQIVAWLNSDDMYLPGALFTAAKLLKQDKAQFLAGNCLTVDEERLRSSASHVRQRAQQADLRLLDYLIQPSCFWTRVAWDKIGKLDESLHYTFDWDWFIRAQKEGVEFVYSDDYLSYYRVHSQHKTGSGGGARDKEIVEIYRRYVDSDCAQLYSKLAVMRKEVRRNRKWMQRLGLKKYTGLYWKLRFGSLTKNLDAREVTDVLAAL